MEHRVNLTRVSLRSLYKYFASRMEFKDIIELLEESVEGGIMDLPSTELPSLMSELVSELQKNSEMIAIAIGSMKNHLDGKD